MARFNKLVPMMVLALLLVASCGGDDAEFPTGRWTTTNADGDVFVVDYRADGTFTASGLENDAEIEFASGTYTPSNDTITFETDSYCQPSNAEQGTYGWTEENDELTFTVQADECADRVAFLDGVTFTPYESS